jgi:hypothetical protein
MYRRLEIMTGKDAEEAIKWKWRRKERPSHYTACFVNVVWSTSGRQAI